MLILHLYSIYSAAVLDSSKTLRVPRFYQIVKELCGAWEDRTPDLLRARQALSQLS